MNPETAQMMLYVVGGIAWGAFSMFILLAGFFRHSVKVNRDELYKGYCRALEIMKRRYECGEEQKEGGEKNVGSLGSSK